MLETVKSIVGLENPRPPIHRVGHGSPDAYTVGCDLILADGSRAFSEWCLMSSTRPEVEATAAKVVAGTYSFPFPMVALFRGDRLTRQSSALAGDVPAA